MLGVASIALRAAGCASPEVSADPISRWDFDETSQGDENNPESIFGDLGPADLPMSIVGSWTDLTTESIVQGDDGSSAFTNGSGYATIPANQSAHNLSALTISFYYQRHAAAAKQILFAAGDGAQAGDFSIEVLANGMLRGYHVGLDGELRFFDGPGGVAGTNLQVGTAHRIDLTLGPQGARIYLDGTELAGAAIPANANGWNNARVKHLGRWIDGVVGSAVGTFDRVRIWNWQLTSTDIAALEPALSTTPPGEPTPAEPLVPSTAEFLANDDMPIPVGTVRYAKVGGAGTGGSTEGSAGDLQTTLNASTSGHTVVALGGTYSVPNGLTMPAGVTLMAKPGDTVIISRCVEFSDFQTLSSGQGGVWTQSGLTGDQISKKIWRSVDTFSPASSRMQGVWQEFGHSHYLTPYRNLSELQAPYANGDGPATYEGPGAYLHSDGRIYIRMQKPHPVKFGFESPWTPKKHPYGNTNPECCNTSSATEGVLNYPVSEDPRDYKIFLARENTSPAFTTNNGTVIGSGINSIGYRRTVQQVSGTLTGHRGLHHGWREFAGPTGTLANVYWNRGRFTRGSCRHIGRAPFKFGGWLEGQRGAFIEHVQSGRSNNLYFLDCTIHGWHEIMVGPPNTDNRYRFKNCTIADIVDDGFQQRGSVSRVEIAYCYFLGSALGGNSRNGSTPSAGQGYGQFYVHHNIFDNRFIFIAGWGANHTPGKMWLNHSQTVPQPRKYYNNTHLWSVDCENQQPAIFYCQIAIPSGVPHEVFNNINVRMDDRRYSITGQSINQPTDSVQSVIRRTDSSNEMWDWNCYWRDTPNPKTEGLIIKTTIRTSGGTQYATLADFNAANPGFEDNGVEAAPQMGAVTNWGSTPRAYRPASANMSGISTSLSGANWWSTPPTWGAGNFDWSGLQPSAWKGALDPNGSTMPVGVQNP